MRRVRRDGGEVAAHQQEAGHLRNQSVDRNRALRPGEGREERRVQRAVGEEPRQVAAWGRRAGDVAEVARHVNLAIGVDRHGPHNRVRTRARGEGSVHRAIHIESRDTRAAHAVHLREVTHDDDLAPVRHHRIGGRVDGDAIDNAVRARAGVERAVHRAVRVQPQDAVDRIRVEGGERAAHDDLRVVLDGDGMDGVVRARANGESGVHRAEGGEAREATAADAVVGGEVAADDHGVGEEAGVGLVDRHRPHRVVRPGRHRERRVHRAGGNAARRIIVRDGQDGRGIERAARQHGADRAGRGIRRPAGGRVGAQVNHEAAVRRVVVEQGNRESLVRLAGGEEQCVRGSSIVGALQGRGAHKVNGSPFRRCGRRPDADGHRAVAAIHAPHTDGGGPGIFRH